MNKKTKEASVQTVQTATEKSVTQVKLEGVVSRLQGFLKDENVKLVPVMRRERHGTFADIEIQLLDDEVKNVYDEIAKENS